MTANDPRSGRSKDHSWLKREALVVYGVSLLLTGAVTLLMMIAPGLSGWSWLGVPIAFLVVPTWVVGRFRAEDPADAGMRWGRSLPGLMLGLGLTLATVIPFAAGYHVWSTQVWEREADARWSNYARWDLATEGRPEALETRPDDAGVWIWSEGKRLRIWWRAAEPQRVAVSGQYEVVGRYGVQADAEGRFVGGGERLVGIDLEGRSVAIEVEAVDGSTSVMPIYLGVGESQETSPLSFERSLMWLLGLLMTQFLLVALPEEYFYRGYIQPTLERVLGDEGDSFWRGLWSKSVVLTSALFALGHFLLDWRPSRLAVFFPSLVFGAARRKSGGLVAPILYHGMCNIMVELAVVHYI